MKQFYSLARGLVVLGLALAISSFTTEVQAAAKEKQDSAEARTVVGNVQYQMDNGQWMPLKKGAALKAGTVVKTGGNKSYVDLALDGGGAVVRVMENSTMKISHLTKSGRGGDADIQAELNLQNGQILGRVKKISKASNLDIRTPNGVAGIRGTDFSVKVELMPDGTFQVTFLTLTGQMVAVGMVGADVITQVLGDGQEWVVGQPQIITNPADVEALLPYMPPITVEIPQPPQPAAAPPTVEFVSPTIGAEGGEFIPEK